MMRSFFILLLVFGFSRSYAQTLPTAPNQRNAQGKRIGEWVISYTKNWKETGLPDSVAYYRKIQFDTQGVPQGNTTDYYRSGQKQWEGRMLQLEPEEINDGFCTYYYENGQKSKETQFVNGKEEGLMKAWHEDGKPQYEYVNKNGQPEGLVQVWDEKGEFSKLYFEKGERIEWKALNQEVVKLYQSGDYAKAIILAEKSRQITYLTLGDAHPDYATSLNNLAALYRSQGQYSKAKPLYLQDIAITKKALGEAHPSYATSLNNLAGLYESQGLYTQAEPLYLQALAIRKKALGEEHPSYATSLNDLALLYYSQGQYTQAEPLYLQALTIRKKALGEAHPSYATSLNNLAALYRSQGQYTQAEPYYLQALAIRKKALGEEHPDYAGSLNNLAGLYESQGLYAKAEPYYVQASGIYNKAFGEAHPDYATSLSGLAGLYQRQGLYTQAEPYYIQASGIYKKVLGEAHPSYAANLDNLAGLYESQGQYTQAEPYFLQALAIRKKALGEEHPDYATSLSGLAGLYQRQGLYTQAEPYHLQALAIRKKVLGEGHPDYAASLDNLAGLYESQGLYSKAEPHYLQAVAILKKALGEEHPDYATSLSDLAGLYYSQGQYSKAEPYYQQALVIRKKALGEAHPDYATSLNNLALLYNSQGQYSKAELYYLQASGIYKKALGEEYPDYATSLNNLAGLYESQGLYSKAEQLYLEALAIRKKVLGEAHPSYANSLNNLAGLYESQGQYSKAEPYYLQASGIYKKAFGEAHPDYATSLNNLAGLYESQGQYSKAEPYYQQALAIRKKALGEEHPDYASSLSGLAELYLNQGQYTQAEPYLLQGIQIESKNLLTFFEVANQAQQEAYFNKKGYIFNVGHSFGLLAKSPNSAISSYQSALLTKGLQLQTLTQLLNYINQSRDTLLQNQYQHYLDMRSVIVNQLNKPITQQINTEHLREQSDSLYQVMARKSAVLRNFKAAFQVSFQAIQAKLKPNEAAIEFIHFRYRSDKRWTDSSYYAALVLRPGWSAPRMVYLCEQRQLDSLVALHPKEKRDAAYVQRIYQLAGRGVELEGTKTTQSLYNLVWKPLDSLVTGVKTIYYSPSGLLNRFNLSAISTPLPRQRLIDKYELIQLSSTRVLAQPENPVAFHKKALLLGSIQYDLDTLAYRKATLALGTRNSRNNSFGTLPYTEDEINAATQLLKESAYQADTLKGIRASEEGFNFYTKTPSPRIIHLATHGFFLEDTLTRKKRDKDLRFEKESVFVTSSNPMMRSGLVLAGGNQAWRGKEVPQNQANGILTAEEISQMNLRNTELVVLSACETGLGDIKGAEGVFGLQRAFKIAGVKYLMMSLWQVSDDITSQFMTEFYTQYLKNKKSVRVAFQEATNAIRKNNREQPYLWAPFVLVE